ncbi:protein trafficking Pga2 [Neurospora hispaniola]|uniref:Protein trafficking Pga2 n=1 Tax=Neurospora hispaniola TaxID=588809 RepID=A0AAJ0IF27_9PEZI|nr:protein trafficking Pga2 [Neurospora hispaniola]
MDGIANVVTVLGDRITNNVVGTFANMTAEKWIRLIIIVGAYALLRPYIIKLGGKAQMKKHEEESAEALRGTISPNELRGQKAMVRLPGEDSDSEDDEAQNGESSAADWGKKARKRQRMVIKKLIEAEEDKLRESKEEEEDKDIEEFLLKD